MTDLERRALLGDRQAQDECTRRGIMLPCPFCGQSEGTVFKLSRSDLYAHKRTGKCALDGMIIYDLFGWNARPAPPIGRCKDCGNTCPGSDGSCIICTIHGHGVEDDGWCNDFEPKGGERNATR